MIEEAIDYREVRAVERFVGVVAIHPLAGSEKSAGELVRPPVTARPLDSASRAAGRAAQKARRDAWAALDLRQDFADAGFLRAHLRAAGVKVGHNNEPGTVERLTAMLRKAGITQGQAEDAVGVSLARFLELNPRLPLWAAVAMVLELDGRFTPASSHG